MFRTIDEFNEDGSYIGGRLDVPHEWCKFYEDTPSYEFVRAHLKISNRGLDVIDAVPIPLCCAMGKTDNEDNAVGITNFDLTPAEPWVDHYEYDDEERAFFADWNINPVPKQVDCMFPIGSLKHGTHTTFSDIAPEVEMFDNTPLATPIKSAIKYATICKSANVDPTPFLRKVESWWDMEDGCLDMINIPEVADISYPRVAGSSSKNSSPIYGMDNYAGRVDIEHTGLTRESFLTEKEDEEGYISVADFGRFNAFMRYVVGLSDALPGASRDSIRGKVGRAMWAISPNYAFKYKKEDFIIKIPDDPLPTVKAGKAAKVIIDYLGSDEYIRHLISMYSKVDLDVDYTFSGVDVRSKLISLKRQISNPLPKPLMITYSDIVPQETITPKYIPNLRARKDICSNLIDQIGSRSVAEPEVAASIGAFINVCSDSKHDYTDDNSKQVILVNSVDHMISNGAKLALKSEVKNQYGNSMNMCHSYGVSALHKRDLFENVIHVTLATNYRGVVLKVFKERDKMSTIYVDQMDKGKAHPDAVEVKGVADALKAWSSYYFSKCWKLSDRDTEADMKKVVMYSSVARILSGASFNVKLRELKWPDIGAEILRKATNYAKKRKKTFRISTGGKSPAEIGEELDTALEPEVSFKDLALCIESCLDDFESDLISRKTNFDPKDVNYFPKKWAPPAAISNEEGVTLDADMLAMLDALSASDNLLVESFTNLALARDKFDIIFERSASLFLNFNDVLEWINSNHGVNAKSVEDLRKLNVNVSPDDLDTAVKRGKLIQDPSCFETKPESTVINHDDDVDNE